MIKVDKTIVYNIVKNHLPQLSKFLKKDIIAVLRLRLEIKKCLDIISSAF